MNIINNELFTEVDTRQPFCRNKRGKLSRNFLKEPDKAWKIVLYVKKKKTLDEKFTRIRSLRRWQVTELRCVEWGRFSRVVSFLVTTLSLSERATLSIWLISSHLQRFYRSIIFFLREIHEWTSQRGVFKRIFLFR